MTKVGVSAIRTLLLVLQYPNRASYYDDWADAFIQSSEYDCTVVNVLGLEAARLEAMLGEFDLVVLLHSTNSDTLEYLSTVAPVLADRNGAKVVVFSGNEYNSPYVSMAGKRALLQQAGCDIVATQLLPEAGELLYGKDPYRIIAMPHALNPCAFQPGPAHVKRDKDFGVRGYRYPVYLGDDDRNRFIAFVKERAAVHGLITDITEDVRLDREGWSAFLSSCRGTISTEAGSWYLDSDDVLVKRIYAYLSERRSGLVIRNDNPLRSLARRLPSPVKSLLWSILKKGPVKYEVLDDFNVSFEEVEELFFRDAARSSAYGKALSSRHFDAIGTRTCQIMLRGRFNDILEPDVHYLAVEPDYSNLDEVLRRFADEKLREQVCDTALDYVLDAHTHQHRMSELRAALG